MDNRTLSFVLLMTSAVMAAMHLAFALIPSPFSGRKWWFAGFSSISVGLILLFTQGWSHPLVGVVAANIGIMGGYLFLTLGMRQFLGLRVWNWWHSVEALAFILILILFGLVWNITVFRVLGYGTMQILITLEALLVFRHGKGLIATPVMALQRLICLFIIGNNLLRMLVSGLDPSASIFGPDIASTIYFLVSIVVIIAWGLILMLVHFSRTTLALAARNQELDETSHAKDSILAMIAHDLRGPLSNIRLMNNLTADVGSMNGCIEPGDQEGANRVIEESAASAIDILENLMHWAQAQRGTLGANCSREGVELSILQGMHHVESLARAKAITLKADIASDAKAMHDPEALVLVVRNLLVNAVKFTPEGGAIEVSALRDDQTLLVSVKDSGVGMSPEQVATLFTPGKNRSMPGTRGERGHGMGLMVCREVLRAGGASLEVRSEQGRGSVFTVVLPL